jgi:hypothetical protein
MDNYQSATAIKKNSAIITALSDFPNNLIEAKAGKKQAPIPSEESLQEALLQREAGDQINSFMLCVLVSKSAKRIKAGAEAKGVFLPMTRVVRSVLRSYRLVAKDKNGPLSTSNPDINELGSLNKKILVSLLKQEGYTARPASEAS